MTGFTLEVLRKRQAVSQVTAAKLLGLSQPMLSHMENGKRSVSPEVAGRDAELFGADVTLLPLNPDVRHSDESIASELAALGYPGLAHPLDLFAIQQSSYSMHLIALTWMCGLRKGFLGSY